MRFSAFRHIFLTVAFLAALTQAAGLSTLRMSQGNDGQSSYLICSSPDKVLTPSIAKAAQDLAELLGETVEQDAPTHQQCSECLFAASDMLKDITLGTPLIFEPTPTLNIRLTPERFSHKPHGPPLGGRAPPHLT